MRIIHLSCRVDVEKPPFDENYTPFWKSWEATIWWELHTFLTGLMLRNHHYIRSSHLSERVGAQKTLYDTNISHLEKDINVLMRANDRKPAYPSYYYSMLFFYFSPFLLLLTEQANLFDIFYFSCILISNKIFEPAWTNGLKYFRFWWRFRLVFLILVSKNSLPVPAVSYSRE